MAEQKQDGQHEHTFSSYVRIRDVVLKTCLGRWTIGKSGERGSGISVLPARHDDDDDYWCQSCARHSPLSTGRPSFFLFLCYSFFLSPHYGIKSHTVVIIIFYATNDFFFNFRISSKSILHNLSISIRKLNYDRRKWANTFLFFFFSSWIFFLGVESCYFFLFSFLSCFFFLFSFGVVQFFFFFFRCWTFLLFSFWGVPNLFLFLVSFPCFLFSSSSLFGVWLFSFFFFRGWVLNLFFLFLVSFPCFLFSGGLVFSLFLLRSPEQPAPK